jgi:hypothetical protein
MKAVRNVLAMTVGVAVVAMTLVGPTPVSGQPQEDEANTQARVLEFNVPIGINRADRKVVSTDTWLTPSDTLYIPEEGYVVLILGDGTISRFDGPGTVSLSAPEEESGALARLTSAVLQLFFANESGDEDAYLAMRSGPPSGLSSMRVPVLTFPPPGSQLLAPPRRLSWQEISGVLSYRVMLFDTALVWQKQTSAAHCDIPTANGTISPGQSYVWVVEAEIGGTTLRSEQATFQVLEASEVAYVNERLAELETSVTDAKLIKLLRVRLFRDLGLKTECYREVESILRIHPGDYTALVTKAELLEEMGLYQQAVEAYRAALGL